MRVKVSADTRALLRQIAERLDVKLVSITFTSLVEAIRRKMLGMAESHAAFAKQIALALNVGALTDSEIATQVEMLVSQHQKLLRCVADLAGASQVDAESIPPLPAVVGKLESLRGIERQYYDLLDDLSKLLRCEASPEAITSEVEACYVDQMPDKYYMARICYTLDKHPVRQRIKLLLPNSSSDQAVRHVREYLSGRYPDSKVQIHWIEYEGDVGVIGC